MSDGFSACKVVRRLYEGDASDVIGGDVRLNHLRNDAWARFRKSRHDKRDASAYQGTFGDFVRRLSDTGLLDAEDFAHPSGSELHLALWLARLGHHVVFLSEDGRPGTKSPDVSVDDLTWEIKQPMSAKIAKVKLRIAEGLEQSPRVIADLSRSRLTGDEAIGPLSGMLADPDLEELVVVTGGSLFRLRR